MKRIRIVKIEEIGNMASVDDLREVILDAMTRCEEGDLVWVTYQGVIEMLEAISKEYNSMLKKEDDLDAGVEDRLQI